MIHIHIIQVHVLGAGMPLSLTMHSISAQTRLHHRSSPLSVCGVRPPCDLYSRYFRSGWNSSARCPGLDVSLVVYSLSRSMTLILLDLQVHQHPVRIPSRSIHLSLNPLPLISSDMCSTTQKDGFICPSTEVFGTASIIWGRFP